MISLKLWEIINPYTGVPVEEEKIPDPSGYSVNYRMDHIFSSFKSGTGWVWLRNEMKKFPIQFQTLRLQIP